MNRAPSVRYDTALPYSADELFFAELACRGGRVDLPIEAVWDRPHDDNTMYRTWQMPDFAFRFLETRYRKHLLEESDGDWLTRSADAHRLAARETAETLAQLTLERLAGRHRGAPSVENIAAGLWIDPTSFIRGLGKPVARGLARLLGRRKR